MTKRCSICKQDKPLAEYKINYTHPNGRTHYYPQCKDCYNKRSRERYAARKAAQGVTIKPRMIKASSTSECRPSGCVYFAVCRAQIWDPDFDPYCFAGGWRYELFVKEYAAVV